MARTTSVNTVSARTNDDSSFLNRSSEETVLWFFYTPRVRCKGRAGNILDRKWKERRERTALRQTFSRIRKWRAAGKLLFQAHLCQQCWVLDHSQRRVEVIKTYKLMVYNLHNLVSCWRRWRITELNQFGFVTKVFEKRGALFVTGAALWLVVNNTLSIRRILARQCLLHQDVWPIIVSWSRNPMSRILKAKTAFNSW